ncbi:MAG: MarP family serine protease [Micromonosporaceae bacterium]
MVDLVLVLLMLIFAVNGYRQGFVTGALSLLGFFGGALAGLQLGPLLARQFDDDQIRLLVSLIAVFGLAVLGQALAGWLGSRLRHGISSRSGRAADDTGGAIIAVLTVAFVAWLVAAPLATAPMPWLARSVRDSAVLEAIDRVMPRQAEVLSEALRDTIDTRGFPDVFGAFVPTQVPPVAAPDPQLANSPVVARARQSVVKVLGSAPSCSRRIEGSGFVYAREHVMTNAHVVAGTRSVSVELGGDRYTGRVVVYDPGRDLAVLYVPGLRAPAMPFAAQDAPPNADAIVIGFPLDGPYDAQSARIRDVRYITGPDIYDAQQVRREVYTIRALVRSGNSGGPLVAPDGQVLGVIFAAAADDPTTGFAVTADEAASTAAAGRARTEAVSTGRCT